MGDAEHESIRPLNLYEITAELEALEEDLIAAGGELTDGIEERWHELLEMEADKVEGYVAVIRRLEASEAALKEERQRLQQAERAMKRSAQSLKDRLADAMRRRGEELHETKLGKVRLQQASRRGVVVDVEEDKLPESFRRIKVSADKKKLAEALESGDNAVRREAERIAHLDEPSYYVRIY